MKQKAMRYIEKDDPDMITDSPSVQDVLPVAGVVRMEHRQGNSMVRGYESSEIVPNSIEPLCGASGDERFPNSVRIAKRCTLVQLRCSTQLRGRTESESDEGLAIEQGLTLRKETSAT